MDIDYGYDWYSIKQGIQLAIGIQLTVVSFIYFFARLKRFYPLAFICLLIALGFFSRVLWNYWPYDILGTLLFNEQKQVFIPGLLFLHFIQFRKKIETKFIAKHMLLPSILYVISSCFIIFRDTSLYSLYDPWYYVYTASFTGLLVYYFVAIRNLSITMKQSVIPKAYFKYMLLFYSIFLYYFQVPIRSLVSHFTITGEYLASGQKDSWMHYMSYFSGIYLILLSGFLIFYAISEYPRLKSILLPKNIRIDASESTVKSIASLVSEHFHKNKLFKNPNLTVEDSIQYMRCSRLDFSNYLKKEQSSFNDFINKLRIDEFKVLLMSKEYEHYDLVGLAQECGFNSKATFYRVFKNIEKITPKEYQKKQYKKRVSIVSTA